MPLILNGDTGISGVDGSAGTPSYQGNDSNTGVFFPAADTIAFAEGGAEIARFDSSGNLGIGTASPAAKFEVSTGGATKARITSTIDNNADLDFYTNGVFRGLLEGNSAGMFLYSIPSIPIVFGTNNTERMRITTAGELLVGATSLASGFSGFAQIEASGSSGGIVINSTAGNICRLMFTKGNATGNEGLIRYDTSNFSMQFWTDAAERMRIGSNGAVNIGGTGTGVYNERLMIQSGGSSQTTLMLLNPGIGSAQIGFNASSANLKIYNVYYTGFLADGLGMDITANGEVLVGTTSPGFAGSPARCVFLPSAASQGGIATGRWGNGNAIDFYSNIGGATQYSGSISVSGTTTSYGTSSDYRLKENIQPMIGALSKVAQLKPVTYTWKNDGTDGQGFIAHELQEVIPDAVTGEKDAVNEDGSIKAQQMDTSFLVATLTAAIQEQQKIIEELTSRIKKLEGV